MDTKMAFVIHFLLLYFRLLRPDISTSIISSIGKLEEKNLEGEINTEKRYSLRC